MPVIRRVKKSQVSTKNGPSTKSTTTTSAKTRAASPTAKGRATQKVSAKQEPRKAARGSAKVTTVAKPTGNKRTERQVDPVTGFGVGTDSDVMVKEAMKGGATRPEVIARIKGKLDDKTATGSDKPVANVFASVLAKRLKEGWIVESSWVLRPPTPQSKAKATKARNAAAAAAAADGDNVTPITKKTATRKRRAA